MTQRIITYKNKRILLLMYKSLVRPNLENAVHAWSLHQLGLIRLVEGVQRRFLRIITELKSLTYEARFKRLNLITLVIRSVTLLTRSLADTWAYKCITRFMITS